MSEIIFAQIVSSIEENLTIIITFTIAFFTGIWTYTQLIIGKNLFPYVQPDLECHMHGIHKDKKIVEIILHLKNVGPSTCVVEKIYLDLNYIKAEGETLHLSEKKIHFTNR